MGRYKYRISGKDYKYLMENAPLSDEEKTILTRARRGDPLGVIACDMCLSDRTMSRSMAEIRTIVAQELS